MRRTCLVGILLMLLSLGPYVRAAEAAERYEEDFGWGLAAVGTDVFYIPAKVMYAALGGFVGGMVYVWTAGNMEGTRRVWSATLGGTYVVTPAMLRGEESILFVGETYRW
jgi:hypothetical protein